MNLLPALLLEPARAGVLPLAAALPLLAAALALALRRHPNLREAATLGVGALLALLVLGLWSDAGTSLRFTLWEWLPGLTLAFEMEPLGLLFATVAGCLWPVTTVYSIGYMRGNDEQHQSRFYCCFAIAIAAAMGIAFAANGLTLFLFYELLTLSTWPLVAHHGDARARLGGRTYLLVLLATSIGLLLPALVWTYALTGTTDFRDGGILGGRAGQGVLAALYALYLFGIGKAALMPFHRWLPAAMVAPTPVSALLHAVAVVKAGVFSVLKVTIYVFGLDTLRDTGISDLMMWVAAFTLLAAALVAARQDDLKARLAYSTVSQLSYIVLGAAIATRYGVVESALRIAGHAAGKITLFFCAGAIYTATHLKKVSELDGLGARMPLTFGAFAVASLAIIGLTPLAGVWHKLEMLDGSPHAGDWLLLGVFAAGAVLSVAYLLPIPVRAFFLRPAGEAAAAPRDEAGGAPLAREPLREAPWACVLPLCLTAAACIALAVWSKPLLAPLAARLGAGP